MTITNNKNFNKYLALATSVAGILGFLVFLNHDDVQIFPNAVIEISRKDFAASESVKIKIDLGEKLTSSNLFINKAEADEGLNIENQLLFNSETPVDTMINAEQLNDQEIELIIYPPESGFKPGSYTIKTTIERDNDFRELMQDFNWGVLAINLNKSIYRPNEMAKIFFGVLDEKGSTMCNANLKLIIKKPDGEESNLSSENGLIKNGPECLGNNVTDQPDYYAEYLVTGEGKYVMQLTAETKNGEYSIADYFEADGDLPFDVERVGPTRINPKAPYDMKIKVTANKKFKGRVTEVVPSSFKLTDLTEGFIAHDPNGEPRRTLSWNVDLERGETVTVGYKFDALDVSPEFYLLGPLEFSADGGNSIFKESRYWQVASDLVDRLILFWDTADGAIPSGWSCISCSGGVYENRFPLASVSGGTNGGNETHTPTGTTALDAFGGTEIRGTGTSGNVANTTHTHGTLTSTLGAASNRPKFATLKLIKSDAAPSSIPQNAIAMFDASPPSGWTTYSTVNDRIILASDSAGGPVTGGSDTHNHSVTWPTLGASTGSRNSNGTGATAAPDAHGHTAPSASNLNTLSNLPRKTSVILAKANAGGVSAFANVIAMFDATPDSGDWTVLSDSGDTFDNAFIEASTSFTAAGGSNTHSHANLQSGASGANDGTGVTTGTTVASVAANGHTHTLTLTVTSTDNHRPLFRTIIVAKGVDKPDVTGNAYADESTTAWVPCDGVTANISLVVNGGTAQTTSCADATGAYSFADVTIAANNPVSVFFNATDSGAAVTVAVNSTSNITLNPRKNRVWVKSETGVSNITNTNLDHCDSVSPAGCANVPYAVTSGALTVEDGVELHIESGKTFAPGGNVTVPNLHVVGTYTGVVGGTETLTLNGSGTGACTTEPGTIRPLCIDGGTFTASETTVFSGTGTSNVEATTYEDLVASRSAGTFQTMSGTATLNDQLTVKPSTTLTLAVNNTTMTVANVASVSGTFTSGTGTKTFSGDFLLNNGGTYTGATSSATTKFRGSAATLAATTTWTKNSEAVVFDRGGGLTSTWTDSNSTKQDMGSVTIAANGGNTTVNLGSSVKANTVAINASQTMSANGSNILTLLGNATPFQVNGTFTPSTGTVEYVPGATTGVTLASISFNNLTLNKAANTFTADGNMTVSGSGTPFVITAGTFDAGTFIFTYNSTAATNITATTYYNLTLAPSGAGGPTYTLGTTTGQTITVSNDLAIGGANAVTVTANTNDPTLDVDRDFIIDTGDTFTASNTGTFTVGRHWTNNGTFTHSSGTVTMDTTATTTLAGATNFQSFTSITAGKTLQFTENQVFGFAGTFTITGANGNQIHIHSTTSTQWKINLTGTDAVTYAHIDNSGCETGTTDVNLDSTSTNGGNNDTCWVFPPNATNGRVKGNVRLRGGVRL